MQIALELLCIAKCSQLSEAMHHSQSDSVPPAVLPSRLACALVVPSCTLLLGED